MAREKIGRRLFLVLLFIITFFDLNRLGIMPASKIGPPIPIFPQLQIDLLRAESPALVEDAVRETGKMLLEYLVPDESSEPWEINFLLQDLFSDAEPEVIFSFALPPERGMLVVLQKKNDHYFLASYRTDLLPVTKLEKLPLEFDFPVFITREDHQEHLGAFCETTVLTLWKWHDNRLREVFTENIYWEINWLNTWENAQASPAKWFKLNQSLQVTCGKNGEKTRLLVEGSQEYAEAPAKQTTALPAPYEFKTIRTRQVQQEYFWSEDWQHFILRTGRYLPAGAHEPQEVAVLKDLATHLDHLATSDAPETTLEPESNVPQSELKPEREPELDLGPQLEPRKSSNPETTNNSSHDNIYSSDNKMGILPERKTAGYLVMDQQGRIFTILKDELQ